MKPTSIIKPIVTSLLLLCLVAAIGGVGANYLSRKSRHISERTLPALAHMAMANQYRGQAFLYLIRSVNAPTETEFHQYEKQIRWFSDQGYNELDLYEDGISTAENRALYNTVIDERQTYVQTRDRILSLAESGNKQEAIKELVDHLLPTYEGYLNSTKKLVDYASGEGVAQTDSIRWVSRWAQGLAVIASVLIFLFGWFLGYTR